MTEERIRKIFTAASKLPKQERAAYLDLIGEGSRLVSVSEDSTLRIWDPNSNHPIIVLNRHAGPVNSLAVDPVRPRIFSASDDGTVQVWDARTARECAIERGLIPSN